MLSGLLEHFQSTHLPTLAADAGLLLLFLGSGTVEEEVK